MGLMSPSRLHAVPDRPDGRSDAVAAADARRGSSASDGDEDLLGRVAMGESAAFEQLYTLFASRVYGIARRVVRDPDQAEEVAQEVFLDVWRRASRFDPRRGSGRAWILAIAHSRAVDRVRSAQATAEREDRVGRASTERDVDTVTEEVEHRFERAAVQHCLDSLTGLQRQSVTLAYYNGYTYPQVAELVHAPLPTVKTRMRDGLIRLRDCLAVTR